MNQSNKNVQMLNTEEEDDENLELCPPFGTWPSFMRALYKTFKRARRAMFPTVKPVKNGQSK